MEKEYGRECVVLELLPLRGEKVTPTKQDLRGSFKNFRRAPPSVLDESPPGL